MLRTLCEMDLAGFGERLFFRMLSSLKLSVITKAVKAMGSRTPNLRLLLWAASALPDEKEILMMILTFPLQKSTYQAICEIILIFLFLTKTLFKQVKLLNIRAQKQAQGSTGVFVSISCIHPHSALESSCMGRGGAPVAPCFCLQATSVVF